MKNLGQAEVPVFPSMVEIQLWPFFKLRVFFLFFGGDFPQLGCSWGYLKKKNIWKLTFFGGIGRWSSCNFLFGGKNRPVLVGVFLLKAELQKGNSSEPTTPVVSGAMNVTFREGIYGPIDSADVRCWGLMEVKFFFLFGLGVGRFFGVFFSHGKFRGVW